MGLVVGVSVGVVYLLIGNAMGKIRPNWFVGIRTKSQQTDASSMRRLSPAREND